MKTILKLSVLSFVFAVTLSAETPAPAHEGTASTATSAPQATVSPVSTAEEIMQKIDACVKERISKLSDSERALPK